MGNNKYEISGTFYDYSLFRDSVEDFNLVSFDDPPGIDEDFQLSFTLDTNKQLSYSGTNSTSGNVYAGYNGAITDLQITFVDSYYNASYSISAANEDVFESINLNTNNDFPPNHQWSTLVAGDSHNISSIDVDDMSGGMGPETITLDFISANLFLLDADNALFNNSPPELVAFNDTNFDGDDDTKTFHIGWLGQNLSGEIIVLRMEGDIEDISRTAVVPLPTTVWLFASGLLGLVGLSRRRNGL